MKNDLIGRVVELEVLRKSPLGFVLDMDEEEVFMHNHQTIGNVEEGDYVDVFLFYDNKKRLAATMETPKVEIGEAAFLKVVSVDRDLGVHLDYGIVKDLLISSHDLPFDYKLWPQKGDLVLTRLKQTSTQLIGRIVNRGDVHHYFDEYGPLNINDRVDAYCIKSGEEGTNFVTLDGNNIFVHHTMRRSKHRVGECVNVKIIKVIKDGEYNGSLVKHQIKMISNDAEVIYDYMVNNDGVMYFHDKSDSNEIKDEFQMSKSAFKRACGNLLKSERIEKIDNGYKVK